MSAFFRRLLGLALLAVIPATGWAGNSCVFIASPSQLYAPGQVNFQIGGSITDGIPSAWYPDQWRVTDGTNYFPTDNGTADPNWAVTATRITSLGTYRFWGQFHNPLTGQWLDCANYDDLPNYPSQSFVTYSLPINQSTFVSQSIPTTVTVGAMLAGSMTFNNPPGGGSKSWVYSATNNYKLGAQNAQDNTTWGATNRYAAFGSGTTVSAGNNWTFNFNLTAPSTPGNYNFQGRMLQENVEWFGDLSPNVVVSVVPVGPSAVSATKGVAGVVAVTWTASPTSGVTYNVRRCPTSNDTTCSSGYSLLGNAASTTYSDSTGVATQHYLYWVTALHTASSLEDNTSATSGRWDLGYSGLDNASPVSLSVPSVMQTGQTYPVTFTFTNTGTTTWTGSTQNTTAACAAFSVGIGAVTPTDNTTWGVSSLYGTSFDRWYLPTGTSITPGNNYAFTFNVKAPATAGTYTLQRALLRECTGWFGTQSAATSVTVLDLPGTPTVTASDNAWFDKVRVNWTAAASATTYTVYRGASIIASGVTGLSQDDTAAVAGTTYAYKVCAVNAVGTTCSTTDNGTRALQPTVPTGVAASDGSFPDRVRITWTPGANIGSQRVLRAAQGTTWPADASLTGQPAGWTIVCNSLSAATATCDDLTASSGITYSYRVFGWNSSADATTYFSGWAAGASAGDDGFSGVAAPANVVASDGTVSNAVRVTWNAAANAATYNLYSAPSAGGTKTLIASGITTLTYDYAVTDVVVRWYSVAGVTAGGTVGTVSAEDSGYANLAPTATALTLTTDSLTASAPGTPSVTDPNTAAGQSETFVFSVLTQPTAGQGTVAVVSNQFVWSPPAAHDYLGVTSFGYTVVDKGGASLTGTATVNVGVPIPGATTLSGIPGTGLNTCSVVLSWTAVQYASSYHLWYGTAGATSTDGGDVGNVLTYEQGGLVCGTTYTFKVLASNAAGTGPASNLVNVVASGTTLNAQIISAGPPASMVAGTTASVLVVYKNIGTAAWVGTGAHAGSDFGLGAQNPQDNTTWGTNRFAWIPSGVTVAPGQNYTFGFTLTAPATPGTYTLQMQMLQPATQWFGDKTSIYTITVIGPPSVPSNLGATQGTVTGKSVVTFTGNADDGVTVSYNVYRMLKTSFDGGGTIWQSVGAVAHHNGSASYSIDSPLTDAAQYMYTVKAQNSYGESAAVTPVMGYANLAPVATSAALTAQADTASGAVAPTVSDPNIDAGEVETLTVAILTQPSVGTATLSAGKLIWTPLPDHLFSGVTTFTYSITDRANEVVTGTATVTVAPVVAAVPASVTATQGTLTGSVRVTWGSAANALSYNVYANGAKLNGAPITATSYDYTVSDPASATYTVRAVPLSGIESADSTGVPGWPNAAPTATSATLTATALTASTPVVPDVSDPNLASGEPETFTFAIVAQPAAGQGTAAVVGNRLQWTPPGDGSFAGATSFQFSAMDRAGSTVIGTASVTVGAYTPAIPTNVTASQGTLTGSVRVSWNAVANAASYDVYRSGVQQNAAPVTALSYDVAVLPAALASYTVRAVAAAGGVSGQSSGANGYPNVAPTSTTASLTATSMTASSPVTPTVVDANAAAGETEVFTFTLVSQPASGVASIVANKLVWSPPGDGSFSGAATFDYAVTDRAGASVNGTATVTVNAYVPPAPVGFTATQGTLTGMVRLAWSSSANAVGYEVLRAGAVISGGSITATTFDYATSDPAKAAYAVRAVAAAGGTSSASSSMQGWPNVAPTTVIITGSAPANAVNKQFTPTVTDPNTGVGEPDTFTFGPATGVTDLGGSFTFNAGGKLLYSAPPGWTASGTDTFVFTATDKAGASVDGSGTITLCGAPQLGAGSATFTNVTAAVTTQACGGSVNATGIVQYQPDATTPQTQVATFSQSNVGAGLNVNYTLLRPATGRAGLYNVHVTLTDASGQSTQGDIPFTVACPAPTAILTGAVGNVDLPTFSADGTYASSDVCAGAMTAKLEAFAASDTTYSAVLATGTLVTPTTLTAGGSGAMSWTFPALPLGSYRVRTTLSNADGTSGTAERLFSVACPAPQFYGVGVSQESGLTAASGLVLLSSCNGPGSLQVQVSSTGGLTPRSLPVTLYQSAGLLTYYRFDYPLTGVGNGTYTLNLSATDAQGVTGTGTAQLAVDRGVANATLTVNGQSATSNSGTAESLGRFGFRPGTTGLPSATKL